MKVLFLCPFVPWPLESGGKIRTYHLIRGAASRAEIHLRMVQEDEAPEGALEALAPHCASIEFFERQKALPLARWTRPKLERWFHSPALVQSVRSELDRAEFDLVHLDELLLARVLPPALGTPVVQHHHKLDTVLYESLSRGQGPQRHFDLWKLRRLERESARRYRHHILCSPEDAELLNARYGHLSCRVVANGFDPAVFTPQDPPSPRVPRRVLFLGSMNYGPNVDAVVHFVRALLPRLVERYPDLVLEIVGGSPADEVRALAADRVRILGRVPEVRSYLEEAAALIVPLRIGGGTRLKIAEALALATPVVSTRIGAEGLGLTDREHLHLTDTDADFVQRLDEVLGDPPAAQAMGLRGSKEVHGRFRWDALAAKLVETWSAVAASGNGAHPKLR